MSRTFGAWLKEQRESLGLSLRDVERITDGRVSNAALSQVETGKIANPSLTLMIWVSAALGLEPGALFEAAKTGNEPQPPVLCPTCGQMIKSLNHP